MDPLQPLIDALHGQGRLRVWSLVITVFGDLVQHRGGVISTARLGAVLSRIGVEPGTLRTALSRLGRDGWVESERSGRTSHYRLSPQGVARFAPATSLIYAAPQEGPVTDWSLFVTFDGASERVRLVPAGRVPEDADCVVTGSLDQVSAEYRNRILGEDVRMALSSLATDIVALRTATLETPLDAAAARVLLIHRWRRLVLRHPEPLPDLLPQDAPLSNPRAAVADIYRALSPLAEAWLDQESESLPAMPAADPNATQRFDGTVGS
jgi:phenylacetic acid degradation operon negative regulatory protein